MKRKSFAWFIFLLSLVYGCSKDINETDLKSEVLTFKKTAYVIVNYVDLFTQCYLFNILIHDKYGLWLPLSHYDKSLPFAQEYLFENVEPMTTTGIYLKTFTDFVDDESYLSLKKEEKDFSLSYTKIKNDSTKEKAIFFNDIDSIYKSMFKIQNLKSLKEWETFKKDILSKLNNIDYVKVSDYYVESESKKLFGTNKYENLKRINEFALYFLFK